MSCILKDQGNIDQYSTRYKIDPSQTEEQTLPNGLKPSSDYWWYIYKGEIDGVFYIDVQKFIILSSLKPWRIHRPLESHKSQVLARSCQTDLKATDATWLPIDQPWGGMFWLVPVVATIQLTSVVAWENLSNISLKVDMFMCHFEGLSFWILLIYHLVWDKAPAASCGNCPKWPRKWANSVSLFVNPKMVSK